MSRGGDNTSFPWKRSSVPADISRVSVALNCHRAVRIRINEEHKMSEQCVLGKTNHLLSFDRTTTVKEEPSPVILILLRVCLIPRKSVYQLRLHDSHSRGRENYDHKSLRSRNQELVCYRGTALIYSIRTNWQCLPWRYITAIVGMYI
jgi:hypothetical protein